MVPTRIGGVCGRDSGKGTFAGVVGRRGDLWGGGGGGDDARVLGVVTAGASSGVSSVSLLWPSADVDVDTGWGGVGVDVTVGGLGCRLTSLRFGRGGGTVRLMGECTPATAGCTGGGGSRLFSKDARGGGRDGVGRGEDATEAEDASCKDNLFLSLSPSLQLAALSPRALAIFHNPLRLGGTGGFSPFVETAAIVDGGTMLDISSSQTFSTMPVRTNAHSIHVVRRRARHQPLGQSG